MAVRIFTSLALLLRVQIFCVFQS